ncbi:MAG: NAD(P)-dependent oxidoreductase, partial [Patescibacteria group bacterium]
GNIGKHVIHYANAFGMKVIAYDKFPNKELAVTENFSYVKFDDLLKKSDIVTLHVPYLKSTHHLIDKKALSNMKKDAYLINTSRGAVVDTEALVEALQKKKLGGAGLDVLEEEGVTKDEMTFLFHGHPKEHNLKTILANHILIDMPNVIITPHNAFNTREALYRILDTTVENIKEFIKGKPINIIS